MNNERGEEGPQDLARFLPALGREFSNREGDLGSAHSCDLDNRGGNFGSILWAFLPKIYVSPPPETNGAGLDFGGGHYPQPPFFRWRFGEPPLPGCFGDPVR